MSWPPLDNDLSSSTVKRVANLTPLEQHAPLPEQYAPLPEHAEARAQILTKASAHIARACWELQEAVSWFTIIDSKDQSDLVRRVEALRDTIEYRASL